MITGPISQTPVEASSPAACCSVVYDHPLAQWVVGDSLHPGGLELTEELAQLTGIGIDSRVLDAGCGRGASIVHLAATRG